MAIATNLRQWPILSTKPTRWETQDNGLELGKTKALDAPRIYHTEAVRGFGLTTLLDFVCSLMAIAAGFAAMAVSLKFCNIKLQFIATVRWNGHTGKEDKIITQIHRLLPGIPRDTERKVSAAQ